MYLTTPDIVTLQAIPSGRAGVIQTLYVMRKLARQAGQDYSIRKLAEQITQDVNEKDWAGEARAVHDWVRDHIRYTLDIDGVETLKTPQKLLETARGDCDDKATLAAALLRALGHPVRFVAVGPEPGTLDHVYLETLIGRRWIASDTTEPVQFGWSVPNPQDRYVVDV